MSWTFHIKSHQFQWKTSVLETLFNKVAGLQARNFNKKRLQHRYFYVKFVKLLRTLILKYFCEWLLQNFYFGKSHKDITDTFQKIEAAVWSYPVKLMFLKFSQNSNKSNCVGVSFWRKAVYRRVINERH